MLFKMIQRVFISRLRIYIYTRIIGAPGERERERERERGWEGERERGKERDERGHVVGNLGNDYCHQSRRSTDLYYIY